MPVETEAAVKKFTIDKGIPIPERVRGAFNPRYWEEFPYPFGEMEVGDSFLVPMAKKDEPKRFRATIGYKWMTWKRHVENTDIKFRSHLVEGGLRVWRIK